MFIFSGHLPRHQKRTALKRNSQLTALIFWEHTSWFLTNAAAPLTDTHIYLHTESFANTKIKSVSIVVYLRLSFYNILTPCIKVENSVTYLYSAFFLHILHFIPHMWTLLNLRTSPTITLEMQNALGNN